MTSRILITGASAGFGKLMTETLLAQGHRVAASMRAVAGRNQGAAQALRAAGAEIVEIDVTDDASVQSGVAAAIEKLGGLDVLVNNAGIGVHGLQESFTPDDLQKLFDVNVLGVHRMNRAALPHLRSQGSGLLVHISSLLGRMTMPFYGPYNASKWALEALVENYRTELSAFGIEAVLVEPGGYLTSFIDRLMKPSDSARSQQYGELAQAPAATLAHFEEVLRNTPEQRPQNVADAVAALVAQPAGERAFRTPVDHLGMGAAVAEYNAHAERMTQAVYGNLGIGHMLSVKPATSGPMT